MMKKEKENWGITLYTVEDDDYFKQWKKIWSGARTCAGAISIKSCLSLLALLANCRSQLVSGLGREKLKVVLFYLTWVSNIFDSFDAHSFVHCSSIRSMHIHSLLDFFFPSSITATLWRAWRAQSVSLVLGLQNYEPALLIVTNIYISKYKSI